MNGRQFIVVALLVFAATLYLKPNHKTALKFAQPAPTLDAEPTTSTLQKEIAKPAPRSAFNPSQKNMTLSGLSGVTENGPATEPKLNRAGLQPIAKVLPKLEIVRAEVAENPHVTPRAVIDFSLSLGDRMKAVHSEKDAALLLEELDTCATNPVHPTTQSIKSLCYISAERLAAKYPTLQSRLAHLASRTNEQVRATAALLN